MVESNSRSRVRPRTIRVGDKLWDQAMAACELRGDPSLSYVLRRMLERYVKDTQRQQERGN